MAFLLALIMVTLFAAMAVAFASSSFMSVRKSDNLSQASQAQMAAESGLDLMVYLLRDVQLGSEVTSQTLIDALHARLTQKLAGMSAEAAPVLTKSGSTLEVSGLRVSPWSFSCTFTAAEGASPITCNLSVTGVSGGASRRVRVTGLCVPRRSPVFEYGVASRGRIAVSGSAVLEGVGDPTAASVLSTREEPVAIEAGGHATISGDLFVTGEDLDYVLLKGSVSIGGTSDITEILQHHVKVGTENPDFPEVDVTPFAGLATTVVDANTDLSGGVFSNIRIAAGTNPDFTSDTVINGIIYVESPNTVTFHGQCTINGMIVTQPVAGQPIEDCQIDFRGGTSMPGVGVLADTAEFAAIKQMVGTSILAPGFGVVFRGNSSAINGTIAADELSFRGTSDVLGEITGIIMGLKDSPLTMQGNTTVRIKRPPADLMPAGFKYTWSLRFDMESYTEPIGQ